MSIKLLPAPVNPADLSQAPDLSNSLVPLTQRAIITGAGQINLVPSSDAFAWSSSPRQGGAICIDGTPVDDSQSDATGRSDWEYVSGWAWSSPAQRMAADQYLSYATGPVGWKGQLIDLYA
jgi:hypothetical protein